ncbi:hypothetical protein [Agrilutibacter solisilvae]|uniref:Uncharacterized protein n=1 Tax=Agrilutibacter solisilvae TaxID=2763317 RepID=A0A975ARB3_9GAMM|nr:hypothetical protein [Lysobacter solisilvae]QSX77482.1 hypothetical protein I8J32_012045 [Lysobacter solisilvae]
MRLFRKNVQLLSPRKKLVLFGAIALTSTLAYAYPLQHVVLGETGKHHWFSASMDVQHVALRGIPVFDPYSDSGCTGGVELYLVDENGKANEHPFTVPANTVVLVTDVSVSGKASTAFAGQSLQVSLTAKDAGTPAHEFYGDVITSAGRFGGNFSLETGAAFAGGNKICVISHAWESINKKTIVGGFSATAQATVITNTQTVSLPW